MKTITSICMFMISILLIALTAIVLADIPLSVTPPIIVVAFGTMLSSFFEVIRSDFIEPSEK